MRHGGDQARDGYRAGRARRKSGSRVRFAARDDTGGPNNNACYPGRRAGTQPGSPTRIRKPGSRVRFTARDDTRGLRAPFPRVRAAFPPEILMVRRRKAPSLTTSSLGPMVRDARLPRAPHHEVVCRRKPGSRVRFAPRDDSGRANTMRVIPAEEPGPRLDPRRASESLGPGSASRPGMTHAFNKGLFGKTSRNLRWSQDGCFPRLVSSAPRRALLHRYDAVSRT